MSTIQYNPSLNDKVNGQLGDLNQEIKIPLSSIKALFDETPPVSYKVYTALLTQIGADEPLGLNTGDLTVGVTYQIVYESEGMDFTNVGAPNNNLNTYFVATGTTPNSWGSAEGSEYEVLTYNAAAPTVTVLENTIGNIYWTYDSAGVYSANFVGAFPELKTFILTPSNGYDSAVLQGGGGEPYNIYRVSNDKCAVLTTDGSLNNTPIEIRVYN
jgi:hypothetical protein